MSAVMDPKRYEHAAELFQRARALSASEREAFLHRTCGEDAELHAAVRELLRGDALFAEGGSAPTLLAMADEPPALSASSPERIGAFRIVRTIGTGGMGRVYAAEQQDPRRTVALKVIRAELATPALVSRFEHEKNLLGRLRHRGIAQIYEAGTADTGFGMQPYFAMELIVGRQLLEYAAARDLDPTARLQLIAQVCDAVEHAHQKGVIHRDLKPSNILVDDDGQPKVLDFGVARATDSDMQTVTVQTAAGQIIGTLAYMSPEQASGDSERLDTRSDIYSLGVIAFELLAGRAPFDFSSSNIADAVRVIQERDPAPLGDIRRALRGDAETIVSKALEKEKERRYGSAAAFAADIRRFLAHEPIEARPPSRAYRARKFVRRHRSVTIGLAATILALLFGMLRAQSKQRDAELARDRAEQETRKAEAINQFLLLDLFSSAHPELLGPDARVVDFLRGAELRVGSAFRDQPQVEAAVRDTLGQTFKALGMADRGEEHARRAVHLRREELGERHPQTLDALQHLADVLARRDANEEAFPLVERVAAERVEVLGPDHPDTLDSLASLATQRFRAGDMQVGIEEMRAVVARLESTRGPEHDQTLDKKRTLSVMLNRSGQLKEADRTGRKLVEIRRRRLGDDHPDTLRARVDHLMVLFNMGRYADGEEVAREIADGYVRVFGADHPEAALAKGGLAGTLEAQGEWAEAEKLFREVIETCAKRLGDKHRTTINAMEDLSRFLRQRSRFDESRELATRCLDLVRARFGEQHLEYAHSAVNLANLLSESSRREASTEDDLRSEVLFREALAIYRAHFDGAHPRLANALFGLTTALHRLKRTSEALPLFEELVEMDRELYGPEHTTVGGDLQMLGSCYIDVGHPELAEAPLREALKLQKKGFGNQDVTALMTAVELGYCLIDLTRYEEAEELILASYDFFENSAVTDHYRLKRAVDGLIALYEAWGKPEKAEHYRGLEP